MNIYELGIPFILSIKRWGPTQTLNIMLGWWQLLISQNPITLSGTGDRLLAFLFCTSSMACVRHQDVHLPSAGMCPAPSASKDLLAMPAFHFNFLVVPWHEAQSSDLFTGTINTSTGGSLVLSEHPCAASAPWTLSLRHPQGPLGGLRVAAGSDRWLDATHQRS